MKKILKIVNYDFKRIVLNPISIVVAGIVLIACIILGFAYDIPTAQKIEATTLGDTTRQIYSNFISTNTKIDTKTSIEAILDEAQFYLQVQEDCDDFEKINEINDKFAEILVEIEKYSKLGSCTYSVNDDTSTITNASNQLKYFVGTYSSLGEFESDVLFTNKQFENLITISSYFDKITNSGYTTTKLLDNLAHNITNETNYFELLNQTVSGVTVLFGLDADKIQSLQEEYINKAQDKCANIILPTMRELYDNVESYDVENLDKMKSLVTNYKVTCQNAKFAVECELRLLLEKHYGNLKNFYNYNAFETEDVKTSLAMAKYELNSSTPYYVQPQNALNFNSASYKVSMYDSAYFIVSVVGFILIVFGIFCAYKLFGKDRQNGKMDLLLSQNVSFNQVFVAKFLAIVLITSFYLALFAILSLVWGFLIYGNLAGNILAVFNATTAYEINPFLFFIIKCVGIELQVIFYVVLTIFMMNLSRKFDLCFALTLGIFAVATICNIFLNGNLVYCLFPFMHADLTSFLGGASMSSGFLKTSLYTYGNFFISLAYYLVVVVLLFNFTKQLFKKN